MANPMAYEQIINDNGTNVYIIRNWIEPNFAHQIFTTLATSIPWQQQEFMMYGKKVNEPRLTYVAGDGGLVHSYTGVNRPVIDWSIPFARGGCSDIAGINLINKINQQLPDVIANNRFNAVLLNFYRDGNDYISPHSDKETSPYQSTVVSVSFGASRDFVFKRKTTSSNQHNTVKTIINNGDLMVMAGACQQQWTHAVPKRANAGPRISATYRLLK